MKLLKVWDSEYPWDVRAEKVMRSLSEAGHSIDLVARNRSRMAEEEDLGYARVHRMRPWRLVGSRVDAASQFPAFVNPRWFAHVRTAFRRTASEAILVRDLPLAPTAVWVGREAGVPVILDMAENYPAMMRDLWIGGRQGPWDWLVRNPAAVSRVESWVVRAVDHVVVVVEESGSRLEKLGVDPSKITVVHNTPLPDRIPKEPQEVAGLQGRSLRLVYLGLLEKPRGIQTVLGGLAALRARGIDAVLDVIGGGRDAPVLMADADEAGLSEDVVRFHGVLPYEDALDVVGRSDIGLIPHLAVESWNTTIPNKLFDYMSLGLAVITSDAKPAARIVREEGAGVVFRSGDVEDFVRAVLELHSEGDLRRCANNGRRAVTSRYNWRFDGEKLVEAVEWVADQRRRSPPLSTRS